MGVFLTARKDPLRFFLETARRYGDVVSMRFGVRRVYLLSHPDHVKQVLQDNHRAYGKGPSAARVRSLFGDSLTTGDGERWRRQRRLLGPAFQAKRLMPLTPIVTEATVRVLDRWQPIAEFGGTVDVSSEMKVLTRTIMVRMLFGDIHAEAARRVGQALDFLLEHTDRRLWSLLHWLDVLTPAHRRARHALETVDGFVADMIEQAQRRAPPPDALLSVLLNLHDAETGERMSDAELCAEVKAFLVAGHTTTASALAWTWHVLARNAEQRQRLRQELRATLHGRLPGAEDLPALGYTRRLIDEVLRLYPPTWVTARTSFHDDEIGGYRIPAGAIILLSPFVTHRHPEFWDDPEAFDPERFSPERSLRRPHFAYFPFGGGPRSCIGSAIALVEMQLVVAMLAQRYDLSLTPGLHQVRGHAGLTLHPPPGMSMLVRPETV